MNTLKAILVDDEEGARDVLSNLLLRFCPQVELLAKCGNVLEAVEEIKKLEPDVVFLDIEMPNYAGYEIVNFFDEVNFDIVFVTAYDQYAIRAFEIAAIDYLLKPIEIDRLKQAVERVSQQRNKKDQADRLDLLKESLKSKEVNNIVVADKGQQHIIPLEKLIAIEAQASYCVLYTNDKQFVASKNLKYFETILESVPNFFRVHKSWIINKDHLLNYSKSELSIHLSNGLTAKLSKYKKVEFEEGFLS